MELRFEIQTPWKGGQVMSCQVLPGAPLEKGGVDMYNYKNTREKYLHLCRKYGLNPFDLDILSIVLCRLPRGDKLRIVRLMLKLIGMERNNKEVIGKGLFPLTVAESERTGYLVPRRRMG
jgi:hypothetical protein